MDLFRTIAQLPRYIQRAGETVFAAPYMLKRSGMDVLVVEVQREHIDRLIDRELNEAWRSVFGTRGVRHVFKADGNLIGLVFTATPRLVNLGDCENEPEENWRYGAQLELAVLVPIVDNVTHRPYWYLPYVLNDFPLAVAAGREVFGYPKQFARFNWHPRDNAGRGARARWRRWWSKHKTGSIYESLSDRFAMDPDGLKPFGSEDAIWSALEVCAYDIRTGGKRVALEPVVTVSNAAKGQRTENARDDLAAEPFVPEQLPVRIDIVPDTPGRQELTARVPVAEGHSPEWFVERMMGDKQFVFLKQFRDPARGTGADTERACYQAAVLAHITPDSTPDPLPGHDRGGLLVTFHPTQILKLPEHLCGKPAGSAATLQVVSRFSAHGINLNVTRGELWWEA